MSGDMFRRSTGRRSERMYRRIVAVIVAFLLWAIADMQALGQTLDVCATCHPNATCDDKTDGSGKVCNCMYGFVGNGRSFCQDKDECQIGSHKICGQHTSCHNTYGSYYCTCLTGYTPTNDMAIFIPNDGTHCQDIDECRVPGICGEGGQCRNLEGSFNCHCHVGYLVHNGEEPFHPQTDKASCKVVDCGQPPSVEDTFLLSATGTRYGSVATFGCVDGFRWRRGDNSSVCEADGVWKGPTLVCEEVNCGPPPALPHSHVLWSQTTRMGSRVVYLCNSGYHNVGEGNVSVCTSSGTWDEAYALCQEILCGDPPIIEHAERVWNGNSTPGSAVFYRCEEGFYKEGGDNVSHCTENGRWTQPSLSCQAKCGTVPALDNSEVAWHNRSVVIHRCLEGHHSWRGSNVSVCGVTGTWQVATLRCIEIKPAINDLIVFNEKCLHWKAEKYEEDIEDYRVIYMGSRDYQRSFHDKRKRFLSSKSNQLELCLNLLPVTNYTITVSAVSARFTATITANTSLQVPRAPVISYREVETPSPTLRLRRSTNTLDPISSYQVFVLPVEGTMIFDCTSQRNPDFNQRKSHGQYITAQIPLRQVGREMNFTVGDGHHYGGFYNAPLQNGRDYYIIVRAVTQWKKAFKFSCVLWAKVKGTSYILKVSSLSAGGTIGLFTLVMLAGYSYTWFCKKT